MTMKTVWLLKDYEYENVRGAAGTQVTLPVHLAEWLIQQRHASALRPGSLVQTPALLHRSCCGRR